MLEKVEDNLYGKVMRQREINKCDEGVRQNRHKQRQKQETKKKMIGYKIDNKNGQFE